MWYLWIPVIYVVYSIVYLAYQGTLQQFLSDVSRINDAKAPKKQHTPTKQYRDSYIPPEENPLLSDSQFMSRIDKQIYLKSHEWRFLRMKVLLRDKFKCQHCSSTTNLSIHHIHYETLGREEIDTLVTLCQPCHDRLHKMLGYSRKDHYPISALSE